MYNNQISNAIFCPIGAFICWLFSGFKGSFDNYLNEKNEQKNNWIGMIALCIVVSVVGVIRVCI